MLIVDTPSGVKTYRSVKAANISLLSNHGGWVLQILDKYIREHHPIEKTMLDYYQPRIGDFEYPFKVAMSKEAWDVYLNLQQKVSNLASNPVTLLIAMNLIKIVKDENEEIN